MAKISSRKRREWLAFLVFAGPNMISVLVFTLIPVIVGFGLSFTDWNMLSAPTFVGFANYIELLTDDPLFWLSLKNTAVYSLMVIPFAIAISMALAIALNSKIRGKGFYRTMIFLPYVTSAVAVALVWKWFLHPDFGVVNAILRPLGVPKLGWYTDPDMALLSVAIVAVWQSAGYYMILFLAGLQGIPKQLYEAASLDGASPWQSFRHITFPLLMPTTFFVLIMSLIASFQVFTLIFNMTSGGPGNATLVYVYQLWENAFTYFKMGYASAMAYILFMIMLLITAIQVRFMGRRVSYDYV